MNRENALPLTQDELRWHWRDSQEDIRARYPREQPTQPVIGAGWLDETNGTLSVWDGRQWVSIPVD